MYKWICSSILVHQSLLLHRPVQNTNIKYCAVRLAFAEYRAGRMTFGLWMCVDQQDIGEYQYGAKLTNVSIYLQYRGCDTCFIEKGDSFCLKW